MTRPGPGHTTRLVNLRLLRDGMIIDEPGTELWMQNGKIIDEYHRWWSSKSQDQFHADSVIDCGGGIVAPGFIDIQINGASGVSFSDQDVTNADVERVGRSLLQYGVTSFLPTLVSSSEQAYRSILGRLTVYDGDIEKGATVLGYHLEGPFINPQQQGAHDASVLKTPENGCASLEQVYGHDLSNVRLITLAPELPGAVQAIYDARQRYPHILFAIGHSNATIEQCKEAIDAGAVIFSKIICR
uniref:Uncharacterized protein n=1 Tax=Spongospora subterranea TaxID=70186 RepID=A0A0H5REN9_9EUKA|eukprot:CRZ07062.1 hypothetical protein [Spongospora subterranea]